MWNEFLFRFVVEKFERLSAVLFVLAEIVVGPIGDALKLLNPKRKLIFDVVGLF